jgi:hypothetical protein
MASYDHAAELQRTQPPLSRLDYLVRQLRLWADANPALLSLYAEFGTIARQLREAGADQLPAEIGPVEPASWAPRWRAVRERLAAQGAHLTGPADQAPLISLADWEYLLSQAEAAPSGEENND